MPETTPPGNVGVIGGLGWLGGAIARAMLSCNFIDTRRLWLSGRTARRDGFLDWPEVTITSDNAALVEACSTVLLAVRPKDFPLIDVAAPDRLLISVMAGVSVARISAQTGCKRIVRAMPNAAAEIHLSYTPWYASAAVNREERENVQRLFESCGMADEVNKEDEIDYFTALTGSGPGFVAYYADCMIRSAVGKGINPAVAERAIRQLFHGAGVLIANAGETPAEMVRVFIDYAGTTGEGLKQMQHSAIAEGIENGLDAAYRKARHGLAESDHDRGSG